VASVRAQTFRDWELIVVDGGSSDGSREWLRKQRGLQAALLSGNPGPAALMNEGVGRARGRLVAFLESDDYWLARHLEAMVGAFDDRRAQIVHCGCRFVGESGRLLNVLDGTGRMLRQENAVDPVFTSLTGSPTPVLLSLAMMRKSLFSAVGPFDESFRWLASDMDFYYKTAQRWGQDAFRFVDEVLAVRRRHPGQLSRLLLQVPRGRWPRRRAWTARQKQSLLDMVCFYRRHERVVARVLAKSARPLRKGRKQGGPVRPRKRAQGPQARLERRDRL